MKRVLVVAIAIAAVSCGSPSAQPRLFKMRIAGYYWPGMYWVDVAHAKGFFRDAGIDADIVDASGRYLDSLDWVTAGKVDTNLFNLYDVLRRNISGSGLRLVIISDTSVGGDAVVAKAPLRELGALKGKQVGLLSGTYQEAVLAAALETAGLQMSDVTLVPWTGDPVPTDEASVDALVTWEPLASEATADGGWNRVFDTSELRGGIPYGYAFPREYIDRHPEQVQRFVGVWHRATTYMRAHPQEAYAIVAAKYRISPADVAALAKVDRVLDLDDNVRAFAYGAGPVSIHTTARKMNRLLIAQGHASRMIDSTLVVEPRFVRALAAGGEE